jgi:hypothetical protein
MTKNPKPFHQPILATMSDRQLCLPNGCFSGPAWAVADRYFTRRYRMARVGESHMPRVGEVGPSWSVIKAARSSDATIRRCIGRTRGYPDRAQSVAHLLWRCSQDCGGTLAALGWTPCGRPRHPLFAPTDSTLECLTPHVRGCAFHEAGDPLW